MPFRGRCGRALRGENHEKNMKEHTEINENPSNPCRNPWKLMEIHEISLKSHEHP